MPKELQSYTFYSNEFVKDEKLSFTFLLKNFDFTACLRRLTSVVFAQEFLMETFNLLNKCCCTVTACRHFKFSDNQIFA